jgi:hypothetical protein
MQTDLQLNKSQLQVNVQLDKSQLQPELQLDKRNSVAGRVATEKRT